MNPSNPSTPSRTVSRTTPLNLSPPQTSGSRPTPPRTPRTPKSSRPSPRTPRQSDGERTNAAAADRLVLEYLRKRGYKTAEMALLQHDMKGPNLKDMHVDEDLRSVLMLGNVGGLGEGGFVAGREAYEELRRWVDGSLDIYKGELTAVLYPMFVHVFLEMVKRGEWVGGRRFLADFGKEFEEGEALDAKADEISKLKGLSTSKHLEENQVAKLFLENRYEIHLSQYAFQLVITFLTDDSRLHPLLQILNRRCTIRSTGEGATGGLVNDAREKEGFVHESEKKGLLKTEVLWGRLRPDMYMIPDEDEKKQGGKSGKDKEKVNEKGKDGKKEGTGEEEEEPAIRSDGTIAESRIPLKKYRIGAQGLETATDRRARAKVTREEEGVCKSAVTILCYTFTNTKGDGLNCSSVTDDGAVVAAGFADSSVRIWDARSSVTSRNEGGFSGRAIRLIGHSGPVYDVDWSMCGRFVLSGGEDGSARLWNTKLKTDVVMYEGHNYPVWSINWAPLGHYFATGSHDRTARIWCTDRTYPVRILAGHLADVDTVKWHVNGNYLATGSSDRTARLWDIREGKCVRVFGGQTGNVNALAMSRDGKTIACGGDGRFIEIWDVGMGTRLKRLTGCRKMVWSLDYSKDGGLLAAGLGDCAVNVWDAKEWSRIVGQEEKEEGGEKKEESGGNDGGEGNSGGNSGDGNGGGGGDVEMNGAVKMEVDTNTNNNNNNNTKRKRSEGGRGRLIGRYETKQTAIHLVKFTRRNVLIAAGCYVPTN